MDPLIVLVAAVAIPICMYLLSLVSWQNSTTGLVPRDIVSGSGRYVSDAEFLAACAHGVSPEIALKVRHIISDQLGIPEHSIHPAHQIVEDLGAD